MVAEVLARPSGLDHVRRFLPERFISRVATEPIVTTEVYPGNPEFTITGATVETKGLEVLGRSIEAFNIIPNADTPPQGRIFLALGWRSQVKNQKEFITHLVQAGFTVTSFNNDFTHGDPAQMEAADKTVASGQFPKIEFVKAAAIKATLEAFPPKDPNEEIGLVANSEATIYSCIAAKDLRPFEYFIQINSAGHANRASLPGMIARGLIEHINTKRAGLTPEDPDDKVSPSDTIRYVWKNYSLAKQELRSIGLMNTDRFVTYLHDGGLPTAYIEGQRDRLLRYKNLKRLIKKKEIFDHVGHVRNAAHEISTNPRGYAEKVLDAVDNLRSKQSLTAEENILLAS